ncbi:hypothetical protein C5167_014298 [Papaver somniferum]|uniref:Uncharacterized protein n=1 Tax=Papaver somniferum TaxID=3469 RepID=A0A4Y7J659_PAPSO|nr:hypothetical protein C5167_014298 [Papaver somniferum]
MEVTNTSKEKASQGYKYDESDLEQLKVAYEEADRDYQKKQKAYLDAKEKRANGIDVNNYMALVEEQTDALCKRVELFIKLMNEKRSKNLANSILA